MFSIFQRNVLGAILPTPNAVSVNILEALSICIHLGFHVQKLLTVYTSELWN